MYNNPTFSNHSTTHNSHSSVISQETLVNITVNFSPERFFVLERQTTKFTVQPYLENIPHTTSKLHIDPFVHVSLAIVLTHQ
jgi:hypothetical protein